jgi:predicted ATP-binding protein involved in virulence
MKIRQLSVAGLRGFDQATFDFDPQFTLLVGVNGVGKSSVLEALRVSLSRVMPKFTASRATPLAFSIDDIRLGAASLTVDVLLRFPDDAEQRFLLHKPRERFVEGKEGSVREGTIETPEREELRPVRLSEPYAAVSQPIAVYFGTRRSHPSDEQIRGGRAQYGPASAYADALSDVRPLHLRELASWMLAQEALAEELPRAGSHLEALRSAAARFLPTCTGLRATNGADKPRLLISKDGVELDVRYLSEGERGVLALALDLARRLSQANPTLEDPVRDGVGVVLIDEIDMHMHPMWQRQIVPLLTETFRHCQFIASSHSPQVIGETQPSQVILLKYFDGRVVPQPCGQAYGLDTSFVLEQIMETPSRPAPVIAAIDEVENALEEADLELARVSLAKLRNLQHGDDPTTVEFEAEINNLEALADEED